MPSSRNVSCSGWTISCSSAIGKTLINATANIARANNNGRIQFNPSQIIAFRRLPTSPFDDRARPGEAPAEYDHEYIIASFDSPGAIRFIERNRYSGSRGVAITVQVHKHLIVRNAEPIGDRLHDS